MEAIGMIETYGLLASIEAADAMVKAANVTLLNKINVGGGLVMVVVTGDVGAVRAAVSTGTVAASRLGTVRSTHVIPRPIKEIGCILAGKTGTGKGGADKNCTNTPTEQPDSSAQETTPAETEPPVEQQTPDIEDSPVEQQMPTEAEPSAEQQMTDIEESPAELRVPTSSELESMNVPQLRSLLRKMEGKTLTPEEIKYANREKLLEAFSEAQMHTPPTTE